MTANRLDLAHHQRRRQLVERYDGGSETRIFREKVRVSYSSRTVTTRRAALLLEL
jgi:hypothetical protein